MFKNNLLKSGWIHAFVMGIFAYPLGTMTQKFVAIHPDINILAYVCMCMLCSSWILLVMAGPGKLTKKALKLPHTWIYGVLEMFTLSVGIVIMIYISATEAAALARTTAIFTFLLSMLFLNQKSTKMEFLGLGVLILGFVYSTVLMDLPIKLKATLVILIIIKNFLQASKKITAELHTTNRKASSFKESLRVTGTVMAVSSLLISSVFIFIAYIQTHYGIVIHEKIPNLSDFISFETFVISFVGGIMVLSLIKYLEFYVAKTLGAKYLMAMASLQIVGIYIIELLLSYTQWFEMKSFSKGDFTALGIILLGNVIIAMSGFFKDLKFIKKGEKQDTLENMEHNFIENEDDFRIVKINLASILALYNNDIEKASEELKISKMQIENIQKYSLKEVKLKRKIAKMINHFASENVSLKDKLTKAYNRYYLEQKSLILFKKQELFKLYYLDLDKFKPINDTYGHDVGDEVLVETVSRLKGILGNDDFIVRLGGDEFVIMQLQDLDTDLSSKILEVLSQPMNVKSSDKEISISTSIGICDSTGCSDIENMLHTADFKMFKNKLGK